MKFDWVFRKYTPPVADEPAAAAPEDKAGARPARLSADAAPAIDWQPRLQAAMGDDERSHGQASATWTLGTQAGVPSGATAMRHRSRVVSPRRHHAN